MKESTAMVHVPRPRPSVEESLRTAMDAISDAIVGTLEDNRNDPTRFHEATRLAQIGEKCQRQHARVRKDVASFLRRGRDGHIGDSRQSDNPIMQAYYDNQDDADADEEAGLGPQGAGAGGFYGPLIEGMKDAFLPMNDIRAREGEASIRRDEAREARSLQGLLKNVPADSPRRAAIQTRLDALLDKVAGEGADPDVPSNVVDVEASPAVECIVCTGDDCENVHAGHWVDDEGNPKPCDSCGSSMMKTTIP